MLIAAVLLVVLIFVWYMMPQEDFLSCRGCSGKMKPGGTLAINPYVWPYSATYNVDDLYVLNKDYGIDFGFTDGPLYHKNTPDHTEMVGYGSI